MAAGIPVVLATRCVSGQVSASYGFPGGGARLDRGRRHPGGLARRAPRHASRWRSVSVPASTTPGCGGCSRADRSRARSSSGGSPRLAGREPGLARSRPSPSTVEWSSAARARASDIEPLAGPRTERWRLPPGTCVVPGITDAHLHLGMAAARRHRRPPGWPARSGTRCWSAIADAHAGSARGWRSATAGCWATAGRSTSWAGGRPRTSWSDWRRRGRSRSGATTTTRAGSAPPALERAGIGRDRRAPATGGPGPPRCRREPRRVCSMKQPRRCSTGSSRLRHGRRRTAALERYAGDARRPGCDGRPRPG